MPGGNTYSPKRPYRELKNSGILAPAGAAKFGGDLLAPLDYENETGVGMPAIAAQGDTQGNSGWKNVGPSGDDRGEPIPSPNTKPAPPVQGGGWD